MARLRRLLLRLINVVRPGRAEPDLAREVAAHLALVEDEFQRRGMTREAAHLAARRAFGGVEQTKDQHRDTRSFRWIDEFLRDARHALRALRRTPGFTAVAVATLALGIGASTAIFSAVNPILFEPLPYPRADRVTSLWDHGVDGARIDVTFGTYRELADRSRSFEAIAAMKPWQPTLTGQAEAERLDGQRVSASYFTVLGVPPACGRDFEPADDRVNGPTVVIISDGLWRRRFGGDEAIAGRDITLNGTRYTVAGVMPGGFENLLAPSAELWAPLQYDASLPPDGREWGHHLRVVGRLRRGIAISVARHELDEIARTPVPEFRRVPWAALRQGVIVSPLRDDVTRGVKPALLAVLGAVLLLLTIACVNVTNLLLARGARRCGEFAMRAALGAGRARLIRQLLTESVLLTALGGALGMVVAQFGVRALVTLSPPGLPRLEAIRLDAPVVTFALGITTLIGLVVGLAPALHASRRDLQSGVQQSSRRTAGRHRTRMTLVVAEVALALMLLVSAGLLLRSVQRLFAVAPAFDASHVLTMQVQVSGRRFDDDRAVHRYFAGALDAVRRVPSVAAAASVNQLPLSGDFEKYGVQFESSPTDALEEDHSALRYAVTADYFDVMRAPLRQGRVLDARDVASGAAAPVAVLISESFAKRRFPGDRREPDAQHAPVRRLAARPGHLRWRRRAAGRRFAHRLRDPRLARRARRSVDRAQRRVIEVRRKPDTTVTRARSHSHPHILTSSHPHILTSSHPQIL